MKRKLKGVLGVGLAFMLVASLMVVFAPVAGASDYKENDWGEWGLPAVDPGTDVGPMAVAPDGTLYAAVGPTSYELTLEDDGDGTAEFSTEAHSGSSSVYLSAATTGEYAELYFPVNIKLGDIDLANTGFWAYSTEGDYIPYITFEFEFDGKTIRVNNDAADSTGYTADWAYFDASSVTGANWQNVDTDTWNYEWVGTGAPGFATWDETVANYDADTVVTGVFVQNAEITASSTDVSSYIDDVCINGLTYDLEGEAGETTGEALLPFGSVLAMSEDNGYTWDDTDLDPATSPIVDIAISPNYEDDELLYVGCLDGTVYRLEEAGEGDVIALKEIVDSEGTEASGLFSMDVWTGEDDYNWILVGTNLDVLVLKDKTFEDWRDQELAAGGDIWAAYEVAFAPDFEDSDLIWAIVDDAKNHPAGADFMITATASPGQWGQDVGEVDLGIEATPFADIGFPDDYDSDPDSGLTNLYVGVSSPDTGDVYLIEGVDADDGESNAIALFDLSGDVTTDKDIVSIAVSGDYGDEVILAGAMWAPEIYISDDGGMNWDDVSKPPTGEGMTYVIMEADVVWGGEVFDVDEGMAFAATIGAESAVSRADDGGEVYTQVGYIDTDTDLVLDLGFHPDFPDTATYLMSTFATDNETTSLWLTENGDEQEPDYLRVLCGNPWGAPGNFSGWFGLVTYSWDAEAVYLAGTDDEDYSPDQSVIWKSTNEAQTFGSKRSVKDDAFIRDWEITDSRTIYAACWDGADWDGNTQGGFYMSTNSGLSWTSDETGTDFNDIAMSPDFEDGEGFILLGGMDGEIMLSDNDGDTFEDAEDEELSGLSGTGIVYVAFDADFADEDADGYMYIYAADDQGSDIVEGEVADTDDVNWDELEDDKGDGDPQRVYCSGLVVAEDNALYALSAGGVAISADIEADGTLELTQDSNTTNTGFFTIPDSDINVISGDFEDEESLTVWDDDLAVDSNGEAVVGTITVVGDDSGATGTFEVDEEVSWGANEAVTLGNYSLWAEISGAVAAEDTGVFRILLWESNNLWESQDDSNLGDPFHLWVTPGTNVLWTIDMDGYGGDPEIWVLEDTCSGQPTLDSPPDGYKSDEEDKMRISWDEVRDADEYEFKYTNVEPDYTLSDQTDEVSILLLDLGDSSEYSWKVRVAPDEPWHSRWSDSSTFFTALGEPPWAPELYTPGGVWQYSGVEVELMPAFSWESAQSADSYQFVLADNAELTSPLVNEKTPESAYLLDFELEYNTNYFWRVMAYDGNVALSRWSDIGAFTTIEKAVAPPVQPPPATVTQPAPAPIVLPTPVPPALLWVIVGIGALLIVAVIVLIVRTRRAV